MAVTRVRPFNVQCSRFKAHPENETLLRAEPFSILKTSRQCCEHPATMALAGKLGRCWIVFEKDRDCLAAFAFRFIDELAPEQLATIWGQLRSEDLPVALYRLQRELVLREESAAPTNQI